MVRFGCRESSFDRDTLDLACFSIEDTLGAICQVPEGGEIIEKMMTRASASRGDVAAATSDNENLVRMMAGMKVSSLLKRASKAFSTEEIGQLNQALQRIRK